MHGLALVWVIGRYFVWVWVWVDGWMIRLRLIGQERQRRRDNSLDVRNEKCCCPRSSLCLSVCLSVLIVSPVCVCVCVSVYCV